MKKKKQEKKCTYHDIHVHCTYIYLVHHKEKKQGRERKRRKIYAFILIQRNNNKNPDSPIY